MLLTNADAARQRGRQAFAELPNGRQRKATRRVGRPRPHPTRRCRALGPRPAEDHQFASASPSPSTSPSTESLRSLRPTSRRARAAPQIAWQDEFARGLTLRHEPVPECWLRNPAPVVGDQDCRITGRKVIFQRERGKCILRRRAFRRGALPEGRLVHQPLESTRVEGRNIPRRRRTHRCAGRGRGAHPVHAAARCSPVRQDPRRGLKPS